MSFSINKVMLGGRLGKDAETRFTQNNQSITTVTLATDHNFKGKDGNWQTETTWHNVVIWGASDYVKNNLKKGKRVYIEGRIVKRDYTDKDGIKRYTTEINADVVKPLDAESNNGYTSYDPSASSAPSGAVNTGFEGTPSVDSDDLPF